jgi:hypothetical protein
MRFGLRVVWFIGFGFRSGFPAMAANLARASRRTDKAELPWFKEVIAEIYEEMADRGPRRMALLDSLLAQISFIDKLPEKLKEEIRRLQIDAVQQNEIITGRQICNLRRRRADQSQMVWG